MTSTKLSLSHQTDMRKDKIADMSLLLHCELGALDVGQACPGSSINETLWVSMSVFGSIEIAERPFCSSRPASYGTQFGPTGLQF